MDFYKFVGTSTKGMLGPRMLFEQIKSDFKRAVRKAMVCLFPISRSFRC